MVELDYEAIEAERAHIRQTYIREDRPASSARGLHHVALLCSDVEQTVKFYDGVLEFPLTEIIENRDYLGSHHFFFDIGNGNLLAFFTLPGLNLADYAEVWADCTISPSRCRPSAGKGCAASYPMPEWVISWRAGPPSTSATRMGLAWS